MKQYEPKFEVRDNNVGTALQIVAIFSVIDGIILCVVSIQAGSTILAISCISMGIISAVFIWGFAEIIFLLTDIKYKIYEEVNHGDDSASN